MVIITACGVPTEQHDAVKLELAAVKLELEQTRAELETAKAVVQLALPRRPSAAAELMAVTVIDVDADSLAINGGPVTLDQLETVVAGLVDQNPDTHVVINANPETDYSRLVGVLDRVKAGGAKNLEIGVVPEPTLEPPPVAAPEPEPPLPLPLPAK